MIFVDSWVWLEFLFDGDRADAAASTIERAASAEVGGLVAPTVLAEVSYRVRRVEDGDAAAEAVRALRDYEHVESMPVIDEVAEYAAELRHEYYERGECEPSYADAIHVATAAMHEECRALYTGDPDFADVDEVETVVL